MPSAEPPGDAEPLPHPTDAGSAGGDALSQFARQFRAEAEELGRPDRLYIAHDQRRPVAFVSLNRRGKPAAEIAEARMFAFNFADPAYGMCETVVQHKGTLCSAAVYPGVSLSPEPATQAAEIGWNEPRDRYMPIARCFDPHHAVVFFDKKGTPIAEITVCFECNNLQLAPGPNDPLPMTDKQAQFFAEMCRTLGVGGCPPPGTSHMPDLPPPPEAALSSVDYQHLRMHQALTRPHGVPGDHAIARLSETERDVICSWISSAIRFSSRTLECIDGRTIITRDDACRKPPPGTCSASVAEFESCVRSRLDPVCRHPDAESCSKVDSCRWGVFATTPPASK